MDDDRLVMEPEREREGERERERSLVVQRLLSSHYITLTAAGLRLERGREGGRESRENGREANGVERGTW